MNIVLHDGQRFETVYTDDDFLLGHFLREANPGASWLDAGRKFVTGRFPGHIARWRRVELAEIDLEATRRANNDASLAHRQ